MPKLPGADQLGVARPQPNTRIASADLTAVARGAQQFGRGVQELGSDLSQISQENRQQQGTTEISGANAFYADGVLSSERTIKDGGNYATYGKDFDTQAEKTLQEGAKLISDPRYREKWVADKRVDLANRRQSVLGAAADRQQESYRVNLGNALERDQNIFTDPATPEADKNASMARINDSIAAAEKTGLLKPAQAQQWRDTYAKGGILKEAELKILNDPNFRREVVTGGGMALVAKDLPPEAGPLLNTIGNTEAKAYNIINGGQSFSSFSDHPRIKGAGGSSTAAGRYQFVQGTWDRAAAATGAQDFSPESQDRAAWWLAQADYKTKSGRDLLADLRDGNYGQIRKTLGSTWEGIHKLTDEQFGKRMEQGGGAPGVLREGNYANLSPDDRQKLFQLAERTQNQYSVERRGQIETAIDNAPTAIQNTGTYTGALPTRDQFMEAYGAEEGVRKYDTFKASVDTSQQVYAFQTMPAEAITQAVEAARPTSSGDDAALEQKQYDVVSRAAADTIKAREADPATYVQQSFPAVRQAWSDASASGDFRAAMAASTAAQQSLGVQNIQPLPKEIAGTAVDAFKKPEANDQDRLNSVAGLVFSTSDPHQRQAVFGQLVNAGLPPTMQGALEASARGDTGAAYRLMQAAIVDPAKLPKSSETKPREVDDAIYASVWAPGEIGDAAYGTSYGDAASLERASVGTELLRKAALIRVSQGQDVDTAVEGAKKDLFGDMTVFSGSGSVNANLPVPKDTDQDRLADGLEASKASFKAAIEARRSAVIDGASGKVADGSKAVIDTATTNRAADIIDSGMFVPVGNGIGMRDSYTGAFVAGPDGNPLVLPLDRIMQMGLNVQDNATNRGIVGRYDRAPLEITVTPPAGAGRAGRYSREVQP